MGENLAPQEEEQSQDTENGHHTEIYHESPPLPTAV